MTEFLTQPVSHAVHGNQNIELQPPVTIPADLDHKKLNLAAVYAHNQGVVEPTRLNQRGFNADLGYAATLLSQAVSPSMLLEYAGILFPGHIVILR